MLPLSIVQWGCDSVGSLHFKPVPAWPPLHILQSHPYYQHLISLILILNPICFSNFCNCKMKVWETFMRMNRERIKGPLCNVFIRCLYDFGYQKKMAKILPRFQNFLMRLSLACKAWVIDISQRRNSKQRLDDGRLPNTRQSDRPILTPSLTREGRMFVLELATWRV